MEFRYNIGDRVKYHGCETYDDVRVGTWKENVIKNGCIVKIHPENKKCYEILPGAGWNSKSERVAEHSIIGIMRQF